MNTLKRISLIRIAPILATVLVVLSFLPVAAGSVPSRLTAKAYTTAYSLPKNINLLSSQWTTQSSTIVSYNWGVLGVDDSTFQATEFTFNCRPRDGVDYDKVFYTVFVRDTNQNLIFHSRNVKANTSVKFTSNPYTIPYSQIAYRVEILVFMEDGSWLFSDDLVSSSLTLQLNCLEQVENNTLPAEWLESTTASFVFIPLDTYTTAITVPEADYTLIEEYMLIPSPIERAYQYISGLIVRILNFRKLLFIIIFNIIIGLAIWLLH